MTRTRIGTKLVAILVATLLLAGCDGEAKKVRPDRLPDVSLANLNGGPTLNLASLRGPAVVNLWASWCVPCKRELPIYAQFARGHQGRVTVLGVDFQETDHDAAAALLKDSKVGYQVLTDPDGVLRPIGLPELLLIDKDGKIAYSDYVEIKSLSQLEGLVEKHLGVAS